jgi:hypothetical protein
MILAPRSRRGDGISGLSADDDALELRNGSHKDSICTWHGYRFARSCPPFLVGMRQQLSRFVRAAVVRLANPRCWHRREGSGFTR